MSNAHNLHEPGSGETTIDFAARVQRIADQNRVAQLLDRRRTDQPSLAISTRPPRRFTLITGGLVALAALDWMAVVGQTVLERHAPLSPWLGTHQVVVATLTMTAAVFMAAWALWWGFLHVAREWWDDNWRREVERDEIDHIRHKELLVEVGKAVRAGTNREWQGYAQGVRDASGRHGPSESSDAGVTLLFQRGSNRPASGTERGR